MRERERKSFLHIIYFGIVGALPLLQKKLRYQIFSRDGKERKEGEQEEEL